MDNAFILSFLRDLATHNNREWFQQNKTRYDISRQHIIDQTNWLIHNIAPFDPTIQYLDAKDCLFRIYRDIRFSHDKSPYKRHFGTYIAAQGGRKSFLSGYYLHIEPNNSALCGGIYCPDKKMLKRVRTAIDIDFEDFQKIINEKEFKHYFGNVFALNKLKKNPQGFDANSPAAEYLKFKEFFVKHSFTDSEVCAPDFLERLLPMCRAMKPFNDFLNSALLY